ncbi:hypothetical protein IC619_000190 [Hazenella sp. IB182353]|uniref:hypothetical protein n=1 Tax=Polycladospora coralii TaxID=2771432 RepID=UPI0017461F4B|nr:hypothetical protein [Polycladospora coralii]MBS7528913.1 hypothetical protein [Polycladospora coralii]
MNAREKRKQIKQQLVQPMLEEYAVEFLTNEGFTWYKRSLKFKRKMQECQQEVEFYVIYPRYKNDPSIARVEMQFSIDFPEISIIQNQIHCQIEKQLNRPIPPVHKTIKSQIGGVFPDRPYIVWRIYNEKDISSIGEKIKAIVIEHLIPTLNSYQFIKDISNAYMSDIYIPDTFNDKEKRYLMRIAVFLVLGQNETAKEIAKEYLDKHRGEKEQLIIALKSFNVID